MLLVSRIHSFIFIKFIEVTLFIAFYCWSASIPSSGCPTAGSPSPEKGTLLLLLLLLGVGVQPSALSALWGTRFLSPSPEVISLLTAEEVEGRGREKHLWEPSIGYRPHALWPGPEIKPETDLNALDQESNPRPFDLRAITLTAEPNQLGLHTTFFFLSWF